MKDLNALFQDILEKIIIVNLDWGKFNGSFHHWPSAKKSVLTSQKYKTESQKAVFSFLVNWIHIGLPTFYILERFL